ncbi:hypothetical protein BHE74_00021516 [Ensete ventricosum]|nr:hypothetical protein GW17_00010172 [Ensete ventricosum]RWW70789.1 hypothetical protein BHE74_00021516 [Ensete ventricosum]
MTAAATCHREPSQIRVGNLVSYSHPDHRPRRGTHVGRRGTTRTCHLSRITIYCYSYDDMSRHVPVTETNFATRFFSTREPFWKEDVR